MTLTTVHMIDGFLSDPAVLAAFLAMVTCNCVLMLYERMQAIRVNALVIEQLRAAIGASVTNDSPPREVPPIWVSYGAPARQDRKNNK